MRRSPAVLLALALLAAGTRPAAAQQIESPIRHVESTKALSVWGGWLFINPDIQLTDSTSAELGPRSAPAFGLRGQMRISGPISGEVGLAFSPGERQVFLAVPNADTSVVVASPTGETAATALLLGEVGLRFHLTGPRTWNNLAPFVTAGGGVVWDLAGSDAAEDDIPERDRWDLGPSFAVGLGVGTDVFLTRRFAARAELNGRLWRSTLPEGFTPRLERERREWTESVGLSIGGAFHF